MQVAENLFQSIPNELPDEHFAQLYRGRGVRVERIVSQGHSSPDGFWYDQEEEEWVLVLEGKAVIEFEGDPQSVRLQRGSYLRIPPHARHRVVWTDPNEKTIWLAIHTRP